MTQKVITLFQDSINLGVNIDVTDPKDVQMDLWFQYVDGKREIFMSNLDYFENTFIKNIKDQFEASTNPDKDLPRILKAALKEETKKENGKQIGVSFDVDATFVDEFWNLLENISLEMLTAKDSAPVETTSISDHYYRKATFEDSKVIDISRSPRAAV